MLFRSALSLVHKHMPQLRVPFIDQEDVPYGVLLENSDSESEDHARARFEALLETAFEAGCVTDAVVADVTLEKQAEVAREFDAIHSVERAVRVGSLDAVISPDRLRGELIERLQKALANGAGAKLALPINHPALPRNAAELKAMGCAYANCAPAPEVRLMKSLQAQDDEMRKQLG